MDGNRKRRLWEQADTVFEALPDHVKPELVALLSHALFGGDPARAAVAQWYAAAKKALP